MRYCCSCLLPAGGRGRSVLAMLHRLYAGRRACAPSVQTLCSASSDSSSGRRSMFPHLMSCIYQHLPMLPPASDANPRFRPISHNLTVPSSPLMHVLFRPMSLMADRQIQIEHQTLRDSSGPTPVLFSLLLLRCCCCGARRRLVDRGRGVSSLRMLLVLVNTCPDADPLRIGAAQHTPPIPKLYDGSSSEASDASMA